MMKIKKYKMFTAEQQRIYEELKKIGIGLANFYIDAVRIMRDDCSLESKAHLLAHLARELDGGFRKIFAADQKPEVIESFECKVCSKEIKVSNNRCPTCSQEIKPKILGHKKSILKALGKEDPKDKFATHWYKIAGEFPELAHRDQDNIHIGSRDTKRMFELWRAYEKILLELTGSFMAITERLDITMNEESPGKYVLGPLKNMLNTKINADHFYEKLDKETWLLPLLEAGFFNAKEIQEQQKNNEWIEYWRPMQYLKRMAGTSGVTNQDLIRIILHELMEAYVKDEIVLHDRNGTEIVTIMATIPAFEFGEHERLFFEAYSRKTVNISFSIVHATMTEELVKKYIEEKDGDSLMNILQYYFGFSTYKTEASSFFGIEEVEGLTHKQVFVEQYYINQLSALYGKAIAEFLGIVVFKIAIGSLERIYDEGLQSMEFHGRATIELHKNVWYGQAWENGVIDFVRDNSGYLDAGQLRELLTGMLLSKLTVVRRMAVKLIDEHFEEQGELWWNFIANIRMLDEINIYEYYRLLEHRSAGFDEEQFANTIAWIERTSSSGADSMEGKAGKDTAFRARRWLTALNTQDEGNTTLLTDKIAYYSSISNQPMYDDPALGNYVRTIHHFAPPVEPETFENMTVEEQARFIEQFEPENKFEQSDEALANQLHECIVENPGKYIYRLNEFLEFSVVYAAQIVNAFTRVLNKGGEVEYVYVTDYAEKIFAGHNYTATAKEYRYAKSALGRYTAELINAMIARTPASGIDVKEVDKLIELILQLSNMKEMLDDSEEIRDSFYAENSTGVRLYRVLFKLTGARNELAETKTGLPDNVKAQLTENIAADTPTNKDFSISICEALELLHELDAKWLDEYMEVIFDEHNTGQFDYRMEAAFAKDHIPREAVYRLMKQHGIFEKAVQYFEKESPGLRGLMKYALFEWRYWGGDPKNGSILAMLLAKSHPIQLTKLVEVCHEERPDRAGLIFLWNELLNMLDNNPALAGLYQITGSFLDLFLKVDEEIFVLTMRVLEGMPHGKKGGWGILRQAYKVAESNRVLAGRMILKLYVKKLADRAFEPMMLGLVEKLFKMGEKDLARQLCIAYTETGSTLLKALFEEYKD